MVGDILWKIDQPASYVCFPISGFISLIATVDHQYPLATTLIGNEGMLGVRRSGIIVASGVLQGKKLIKYTRGGITVLDRKGLEGASCSCYLALVADYTKVFGVKVISRLAA